MAGHKPRHRLHRSDAARVGEAHGHLREVVEGELAFASASDEIVEHVDEAAEVELFGVLDRWHQQRPTAVRFLNIDRHAERHAVATDQVRFAVGAFEVAIVHRGNKVRDGPHDCVADDVGETDLAAAGPAEMAVDDLAVYFEKSSWDVTEARSRRNLEAGLHVLDDLGRDASNGLGPFG